MRLLKFSIVASLLLATPPLFASLLWPIDQLNVRILNETNTLCKISQVNVKHGLDLGYPGNRQSLLTPHKKTSISLRGGYLGSAVDIDLVCGDKKISLSTWQDGGIVFSGDTHGTVLSADNGIRATLTIVPHWRVGGFRDVNWTLLND